jgi:hypothetical protein
LRVRLPLLSLADRALLIVCGPGAGQQPAIRDLKAGAGLAHLPSGRFAANSAWLLAATLAHNLIRWTASLGLGVGDQQTVAKTLRRTLLALPGRLTRSARQWTLHLPAGWPWAHSFTMALARLRCIPYPT